MSDASEDDNEISFRVKFLGRVEVVHPDGLQILEEAAQSIKTPEKYSTEKAAKKSKVHLFLSQSGIDILENKTKVFGFVARHPAADMCHCYLFQSKMFSHVLVSVIGDAFRASTKEESIHGRRDLIVEALRHKNKMLQRENAELNRRLAGQSD